MRSTLRVSRLRRLSVAAALVACAALQAAAQPDAQRQVVAITYPLDQNVTVKFKGTTRLPRLSGEAKVKRTGRRNTRVELEVKNLPRAFELGTVYTTYILWAITPEGQADKLGEIKRSGSFIFNSKLDVTTPLQNFALILTAEPHFLVRTPSRMVVLENLPPRDPGQADIATFNVQYIGNTSDYFNDTRVPDLADQEFIKTPVSIHGARQAINLARYAGAQRDAANELREAQAKLEEAENAWRLRAEEEEVDVLARQAISLGAKAEEMAEARAAARKRRDEIARRDEAVRDAERSAASASDKVDELRAALRKEEQARILAERDALNANQQLRDLRAENTRLNEELRTLRADAEQAKLRLARMEGEREAETARTREAARAEQQRQALGALKATLARFGTVRESERGLMLVLPDSVWSGARASELTARAASSTVEPLAALLANNPDFQIFIEAHADDRGDADTLQRLTQDRAEALAGRLVAAGVDSARINASGMGGTKPLASNANAAGRGRNRRVEITLVPAASAGDTAVAGDDQN
ncbi:MAG TPA: OmpA family protein [Pyrinomonadaceae bacterium]|nr:OmpA family protein [Pyrinomonadaceae bacterium]